jgi:two-component system, NarL family, response regulator NreC
MIQSQIRLLIVDDHKILRDGLRALLESEENLQVVGEADTGAQAIAMAASLRPEVIIMDISLPDMSGLDAIRLIRQTDSTCRIVVLSMYSRREFVVQALEAGCDGYVPKSATHTSLVQAITVVMAGERYLHPTATTALVGARSGVQSESEKFSQLSEREQEVLRLTVLGFNSREVGEQLILSPKTVETYRVRAMEKLGIEHRSDLVQFALRAGILQGFED